MDKIVKRKWTNKKTGKVQERVYVYESSKYNKKNDDRKTSNFMFTASGKLKKTKLNEVYNALLKKGFVTVLTGKKDIESKVQNMLEASSSKFNNVTVGTLITSYTKDKLLRMLSNTGFTIKQLADRLGVSENELLNESNWYSEDGKQYFLKDKDGVFEFKFNYEGSDQFERVSVFDRLSNKTKSRVMEAMRRGENPIEAMDRAEASDFIRKSRIVAMDKIMEDIWNEN